MMTDDRPPADGRQRWKSYGYGPQVRRQFLLTYAVFGSFLLVLVLEAVSALEQHPWVGVVAAALAAWLSFYLGRAVYRHLWLMTHREVVPVTPPTPDPTKRAWVWSAVRQGRVLEPEERDVAAGTARYATRAAAVHVETRAPRLAGTTVADYRGLWGEPPSARIVSANHPQEAFAELIESLGALARRVG